MSGVGKDSGGFMSPYHETWRIVRAELAQAVQIEFGCRIRLRWWDDVDDLVYSIRVFGIGEVYGRIPRRFIHTRTFPHAVEGWVKDIRRLVEEAREAQA